MHVILLLTDMDVGRDQLLRGTATRAGIVVPLCLMAAWLSRGRLPILVQGCAGIIPAVVSTAIDTWLGAQMPPHSADRSFMGLGMGLFFNNLIMPLRVRHAAVATLASLAIYSGTLSGGFGPSPIGQGAEIGVVMGIFVLISLGIRCKNETHSRRTFLLGLRDRLHLQQLAWANRQLTELSYTDPLTGLPNRRFFDEVLTRVWRDANESGEAVGLIMIDVDHFKEFNDAFGHSAGDKCLQSLASALRFSVRVETDTIARFGGEEFVAILPAASQAEALHIGERIRCNIAELQLPHPSNSQRRIVTVSLGVATCPSARLIQPPELLKAADSALYAAKSRGRNCVMGEAVTAIVLDPSSAKVNSNRINEATPPFIRS
jgi:diguanylate cyclase (GGDEF)-like protein